MSHWPTGEGADAASGGAGTAAQQPFVHNCLAMYEIAPKRCTHCVSVVATVQLDHAEEFGVRAPVVICGRCDTVPGADETLHVPADWY